MEKKAIPSCPRIFWTQPQGFHIWTVIWFMSCWRWRVKNANILSSAPALSTTQILSAFEKPTIQSTNSTRRYYQSHPQWVDTHCCSSAGPLTDPPNKTKVCLRAECVSADGRRAKGEGAAGGQEAVNVSSGYEYQKAGPKWDSKLPPLPHSRCGLHSWTRGTHKHLWVFSPQRILGCRVCVTWLACKGACFCSNTGSTPIEPRIST